MDETLAVVGWAVVVLMVICFYNLGDWLARGAGILWDALRDSAQLAWLAVTRWRR